MERERTQKHETNMSSIEASSIQDEIDHLQKNLPKGFILPTTNHHFITAVYERTPKRKAKATLTFPDEDEDGGYPAKKPLIIVVTIDPPGLKRKLEKQLSQIARENLGRFQQVLPVLQSLKAFLDTNRFVPCWKELKQGVDLVNSLSKPQAAKVLAMKESKGVIKLQLNNKKYQYTCSITIDEGYPTTTSIHDWGKPCHLKTIASNFPSHITTTLQSNAQIFVRHLQDGMPEIEARRMIVAADGAVQTTTTTTTTLIAGYEIPTYDGSNPRPSLLPLIRYLIDTIYKLPEQRCPECQESALPSDPTVLASLFPTKTKTTTKNGRKQPYLPQRPLHASCGCWYHYKCLETCITQPPFGIEAPSCKGCQQGPVEYPALWSKDPKELEEKWNRQQAKQREIDDVALLF